jgi:hypothetical protein
MKVFGLELGARALVARKADIARNSWSIFEIGSFDRRLGVLCSYPSDDPPSV